MENRYAGELAIVQTDSSIDVYENTPDGPLVDKFPVPDWSLDDVLGVFSSTGTFSPVYSITLWESKF